MKDLRRAVSPCSSLALLLRRRAGNIPICQRPTSLTLKEPRFSLRIPFTSHYTLQEQSEGNCFSQSIQKQQAGECGITVPEQRTVNPAEELQETEMEEQRLTKELCLSLEMS